MTSPLTFRSFLGNGNAVRILRRAIERERLPHALIFAGPAGVGKKTLAGLAARVLNCPDPVCGEACNACRSCRKIAGGTHPDVRVVEPEGAYIKIDQVRAMIGEIAFQPFEGTCRVVILDGADQMRQEAANCLLKTLEEPVSRSILILVTDKPYLLLGTIRSRARTLQFGSIAEDAIARYLVEHEGRSPEDARMAAVFSNGSLAAALTFDVGRNRDIRSQALRFISLMLRNGEFAQASAQAAGLVKEKDAFQEWVEMTATLLQDVYYAQVAPGRMGQPDLARDLTELARAASHEAVVEAIHAIRKLKADLQRNANRQLALEALFLSQTVRGSGSGDSGSF